MSEDRAKRDALGESLLVLRRQVGSDQAFEMLFRRYNARLLYYLRRLLGDGGRAEDVLQNVWLTVLRKILSVAVEQELLKHVPQVKWLKTPEPDFDFLTFEEADLLARHADPEWYPMIVVALRTGLRLGELLALRWADVALRTGKMMVRQASARGVVGTPKSGRRRDIPLSDEVVSVLKRHRHLKGELVFCQDDGTPLTKGQCKWPLWRACRRAELREIGWHVLRHTFASHLTMLGAPLKVVQELLGHSTIEMTTRYAHLSPDVRRDAVRMLDRHGNLTATREVADRKPWKAL